MKKVGIIGGIGPASTLDYYKDIIDKYRGLSDGDDYPQIVIDSINMTEMLGYIAENRLDNLVGMLVDSIKYLAAAKADFAAIASNTPHIVFERVRALSPLPLISIVDETCKVAKSRGYRRVVVLGTLFTMSSGLYTAAFEKYDIEAFVPDEKSQNKIHGIIFPKLEDGIVIEDDKRAMLEIAQDLIKSKNADALVLGCTELPLMIKPSDTEIPLLNTTQIHIDSIVRALTDF